MLEILKTQLTAESETDDGSATDEGLTNSSEGGADGTNREVAAKDSATDMASDVQTVELNEVFGLLKNRRRRDVLRHLRETTETVRLGELAEQIAARECEKDVSQINSQERKRVYVGLYQCHLPKLADVGVIEYNKPRGTIERGPTFEQVSHYLPEETHVEQEPPNRQLLDSLSSMLSTGRQLL